MELKRCPFCKELNELDHRFCVHCGKELPVDYELFGEKVAVDDDEKPATANQEFIECPNCRRFNYAESAICKNCGYDFKNNKMPDEVPINNNADYDEGSEENSDDYNGFYGGNGEASQSYTGSDAEAHSCMDSSLMDRFNDMNRYGGYDLFKKEMEDTCKINGAEMSYFQYGVVGCPDCGHYFNFITDDFMNNLKCPHCGRKYNVRHNFHVDEWDREGVSYEEWMEMQGHGRDNNNNSNKEKYVFEWDREGVSYEEWMAMQGYGRRDNDKNDDDKNDDEYVDEWDREGVSYEEWMEMYG